MIEQSKELGKGFDFAMHTPTLLLNLARVRENWQRLALALPSHSLHYAMKCNPHESILLEVLQAGGGFEVASLAELAQVLGLGADPVNVIFGNPVRPRSAIARAYELGVRRFTVDSPGEVRKLADVARNAQVAVRLQLPPNGGSEFPLRDKFGCLAPDAIALLLEAEALGLEPTGLSFHVGSQSTDPRAWDFAIEHASSVLENAAQLGVQLHELNIGGGLPVAYGEDTPSIEVFADAILEAEARCIPDHIRFVAEPGRAVVADAGVMVTEVLGRASRDGREWLYVDVGAFTGLIEPFQSRHHLKYVISAARASEHATVPFVIGGPTCDGDDVVGECAWLPADIDEGDLLLVHNAGAYSTAYAAPFNGFSAPAVEVMRTGGDAGQFHVPHQGTSVHA